MTKVQFAQFLSRTPAPFRLIDITGRVLDPAAGVKTGIYFLQSRSDRKKLLIVD